MFVLTVDQQRSRSAADRVPDLLSALAAGTPAVLPFERTAGDEVQGVLDGGTAVVEAVSVIARSGGWSVGVGTGPAELPLPTSTRAARGPAFLCAREAVESARRRRSPRLCVRGADPDSAHDAEVMLRLILAVLADRSPAAWQACDLVRGGATHAQAAERLGISRQAVGQRLAAGRVEVEGAARPLAARLLDAADR